MKRIVLLLGIILVSTSLFAQEGEAPLSRGDMQINFGLGFGTWGLPVYGGLDIAVHDDVTIGPEISVIFDRNVVYFGAVARGDYHFNRIIGISQEWDFYAGASLGFRAGPDFNALFGVQVGGRWYWDERWGLNVEIGGGSFFGGHIGVSMKI